MSNKLFYFVCKVNALKKIIKRQTPGISKYLYVFIFGNENVYGKAD